MHSKCYRLSSFTIISFLLLLHPHFDETGAVHDLILKFHYLISMMLILIKLHVSSCDFKILIILISVQNLVRLRWEEFNPSEHRNFSNVAVELMSEIADPYEEWALKSQTAALVAEVFNTLPLQPSFFLICYLRLSFFSYVSFFIFFLGLYFR